MIAFRFCSWRLRCCIENFSQRNTNCIQSQQTYNYTLTTRLHIFLHPTFVVNSVTVTSEIEVDLDPKKTYTNQLFLPLQSLSFKVYTAQDQTIVATL